jgi:hypothetical protein
MFDDMSHREPKKAIADPQKATFDTLKSHLKNLEKVALKQRSSSCICILVGDVFFSMSSFRAFSSFSSILRFVVDAIFPLFNIRESN